MIKTYTKDSFVLTEQLNDIYSEFINERVKTLSNKANDYIKMNIDQIKRLMNKRNATMKEKFDFNILIKTNFRKNENKLSKGKKIR